MELNLRDTELRLGLPGSDIEKDQKEACMSRSNKRSLASEEESTISKKSNTTNQEDDESCPPAK